MNVKSSFNFVNFKAPKYAICGFKTKKKKSNYLVLQKITTTDINN